MFQVYELDAFIQGAGGSLRPFYLHVSVPRSTEGQESHHCIIQAPELFKKAIKIYGADAKQARQLSLYIVRSVLEGRRIVDKDGNEVHI